MSLSFETAAPPLAASPNRTDVACFIGYVARRAEVAVPAGMQAELAAAGWANGPWRRGAAQLHSLENLPVTVESWEAFAQIFAWEKRPLGARTRAGAEQYCATYLGAAVRSFFARGGRRAVIIRAGDPWPYLESAAGRAARRRERIRRLVPDFADRNMPEHPFDATNPASWLGIQHVYGLGQVSLLCLPDLPDACAVEPPLPAVAVAPPLTPEVFVECGIELPEVEPDAALRLIPAPRLDSGSYAPWRLAVSAARAFLARHQREVILLAALPLPHVEAKRTKNDGWIHAEADFIGFLRRSSVLEAESATVASQGSVASAFVQLAWPWLKTRDTGDLPEAAEPPDGALAGLLAANALARGTFRSAGGSFSLPRLRDVQGSVPSLNWSGASDSPEQKLAQRACLFVPSSEGWLLHSDVTSSMDFAWRFGGASRLMGAILRAARRTGEAVVFDLSGPRTWDKIKRSMSALLQSFWQQGALNGATPEEGFQVRCGHDTMTQNDLDNGRLIVEITVWPAAAIEHITVVLNLSRSGASSATVVEAIHA